MTRALSYTLCATGLFFGLAGCQQQYVRNCPIIGADPSSNLYYLDYELMIPADCPIPLANPGTEKKYAAARVRDLNGVDMEWARVEVKNSNGERVASNTIAFLVIGGIGQAEPTEEYTAATGTSSVSDYDMATFTAWSTTTGVSAKGTTKLTYQPTTLSTKLSGEAVPLPNTTHTWNAPTTGGYPGFSYQWYRDGTPVGTGSSYTGTVGAGDFGLRVDVTDQTWSTVSAVLAVNVGGVQAGFTGPVTLQEGTRGTWTASARGGTGTYTYKWYYDDNLVSTASSYIKAPAAGLHELRLEVLDSAGEYDSHTLLFRVTPAPCPNGARVC